MKYDIITTEKYLLVLGELCKQEQFPYIVAEKLTTGTFDLLQVDSENDWDCNNQYKILAYLPLNNAPILDGMDLLPPLEDEVEKLADEYANSTSDIDVPYTNGLFYGFIEGYNKAKEKYKYTEEDIRKAIDMARTLVDGKHEFDVENILGSSDSTYDIKQKYTEEEIIQSLQQPKMPVGFECEVQTTKGRYIGRTKIGVTPAGETITINEGYEEVIKPKTTTNSQGLTQWVGEYIY